MEFKAKDFNGQAEFLIRYIKNGSPVPAWMNGERLLEEEVKELLPVQRIGHSISRGIYEQFGINMRSGTLEWRRTFIHRMKGVLADYSWLS